MTTHRFIPAGGYRGEGAKTKRGRGMIGRVCDYEPVGWDRHDPKVIKGHIIKAGSKVVVTGVPDPVGMMRWVRDSKGNEMAVMRKSLSNCRRQRQLGRVRVCKKYRTVVVSGKRVKKCAQYGTRSK